MILVKTPLLIKRIYYSLFWNLSRKRKYIYLTFDDGPTPKITYEVLDLLDQYNAKATFFVLGRNVERYPEIYAETIRRGHTTGNHTYSHLKGWKTPNDEYYSDCSLADQFIKNRLFRPPYGKIKRSQLKYLKSKYRIIMWDVMSYDFSQSITREKCLNYVLHHTLPGSIVVFHDSVKSYDKMMFALSGLLENFSKKGYEFRAI